MKENRRFLYLKRTMKLLALIILNSLVLDLKQVPLIGTVQAGTPITAVENLEATLTLPVQLTGDSDCFMLRVQGDR